MSLLKPTELLWIFGLTPGESARRHFLENLLEGGNPWEPSAIVLEKNSVRMFLPDALIMGEHKLGTQESLKRLICLNEYMEEAQTIEQAQCIGDVVLFLLQQEEHPHQINQWWEKRGQLDETKWIEDALNQAVKKEKGSEYIISWINAYVMSSEVWPESINEKLENSENLKIQSAFYQTFNTSTLPKSFSNKK